MGWQDAPVASATPSWMKAPPVTPPKAAEPPSFISRVGQNLAGEGEIAGAGLGNIIPSGINSLNDILNFIHRTPGAVDNPVPTIPVGQAGKNFAKSVGGLFPGTPNKLDISDEELRQLDPTGKVPIEQLRAQYAEEGNKPLGQLLNDGSTTGKVASGALRLAGDVGGALPAAGLVKGGAGVVNSIIENAAKEPVTDIESALRVAGFRNLPRQGEGSAPAQFGAKITGEPPLAGQQTLSNQEVTNTWAKHEAGIPQDSDVDYDAAAKARAEGPGKVYDAAEAALPENLTHDEQLTRDINGVNVTTSQLPKSPDVEALKQYMVNQPNMTRGELFKNIQVGRERAARFYASDTPGAQDMGDAYRGLAEAYEEFVDRQLRSNPSAGVTPEQWQDARTAFAKNYAVQAAIVGKDVDASKIAAMQRKDPDRLTGGLRLIAEQYNRYPLSTGFGPKTFEQGGVGASGTPQGIVARHITGPLIGGGIGSLIGGPVGAGIGGGVGLLGSEGLQSVLRRVLGGTPGAAESVAGRAVTDPRLGTFFDQLAGKTEEPPFDLQPPPGRAFTPHQPQAATGNPSRSFFGTGADAVPGAGPMGAPGATAEHPGQIPLFDVLSHGVEQPPALGLSAGPMGTPPGRGVPFTRNAGHEAGGLSLTDELEQAAHENNSDLAGVKSARIPDRTIGAERTLPKESPTPGSGSVDLPTRPGLSDDELSIQHEPTLAELLEDLSHHPDVMSQGVPEDAMQRTPRVNRGGSDTGSIKAASPEGINRGTRNVLQIDPDARATPVLKDVTQIDAKAPPGHLLIDGDTHEILDRGGLPLGHAKGLLNRYIDIHARPPLMEEFE